MIKVAWVLINASHYHVSRWQAFIKRSSMDAVMVEIANRDAGFDALSASNAEGFDRVTLFPGKTWVDVSGRLRRIAIRAALDRLMPDVVCINGWSIGGSIATLEWAIENDRRVVVFSDSNQFDRSRHKASEWMKSTLVGLCHAGFAGGTASQQYLIQLGLNHEQLSVGYDVVDNAHFACADQSAANLGRPERAPKGPYFVAAARFEPKKNHARLLQAFAKYREACGADAWSLVLLGDGMLRPEIEAERDRLGLGSSVVLPGFASYEALPQWYQYAACFVHPSTTEQWGLVVNEAMASGLPVLVSERCGCARDLIDTSNNGFTFDPYKVDRLAELMFRISSPDCDRKAMGRVSLEIIDRWSPETFAAGLEAAVQAALEGKARRAGLLDRVLLRALSYR